MVEIKPKYTPMSLDYDVQNMHGFSNDGTDESLCNVRGISYLAAKTSLKFFLEASTLRCRVPDQMVVQKFKIKSASGNFKGIKDMRWLPDPGQSNKLSTHIDLRL